jgi:hypothetical protein
MPLKNTKWLAGLVSQTKALFSAKTLNGLPNSAKPCFAVALPPC